MMEFCAVAIKWSRSNDNFEKPKKRRKFGILTEKREVLWIRNPYTQIIPENYRKYYLFTFYLYPSGYFKQSEKNNNNIVYVHLIIFTTTLFSVHIRFSSFRSQCKKWNNNSNCIWEKKNGCNHFLQFFVSQYSQLYSLFEQNMKRKMCFCFSFFIL